MFDSTAPYLFIPPSMFNDTINLIVSKNGNYNFSVQNGLVYMQCNETLLVPLSFMV